MAVDFHPGNHGSIFIGDNPGIGAEGLRIIRIDFLTEIISIST